MSDELFCDENACKKCKKSLENKKDDALHSCLECEKVKKINKDIRDKLFSNIN
jgi:hypothetical protein